MLKKTIRFSSYVLAFFGLGVAQSCGDDEKKVVECYECTTPDEETYTYCFADYKDYMTRSQFEQFIKYIEDEYSYNCVAAD